MLPPPQSGVSVAIPAAVRAASSESKEDSEPGALLPDDARPTTMYHKVMKKVDARKKAAINAWTQGSLRMHSGGERVLCPMCQVPVKMKHLIWQCSYHEQSLPAEWVQMMQANESTMLWARGLIDAPGCHLEVGSDSCEVEGIFSHGWPVRIGPHQRLAIVVQATWKDPRLRNYAVAVIAGQWQDGGSQATEARGWFFGCWLILQLVLGKHQLNIPHKAGWTAIKKGAEGTVTLSSCPPSVPFGQASCWR